MLNVCIWINYLCSSLSRVAWCCCCFVALCACPPSMHLVCFSRRRISDTHKYLQLYRSGRGRGMGIQRNEDEEVERIEENAAIAPSRSTLSWYKKKEWANKYIRIQHITYIDIVLDVFCTDQSYGVQNYKSHRKTVTLGKFFAIFVILNSNNFLPFWNRFEM